MREVVFIRQPKEQFIVRIDMEETGKNLKRIMDEYGYSVTDLRQTLGFESSQAVYKWINGVGLFSVDSLIVLCNLFDIDIRDLIVYSADETYIKPKRKEPDACR